MKADTPRQNRIPFMMSDAELEAIDEWRFKNRIGTRADAIRRLTTSGLALDRLAEEANESRKALWSNYMDGADALIEALKTDQPDWRLIAVAALELLGSLSQSQAELSHHVNAMAEISVRMREARAAAEGIAAAQQIEVEAKKKLRALAAAYQANEEAGS